MISAWRITKRKHQKSAFSGEGARLYGGRWNSRGTAMVYTAQAQSLAMLEMLVHLESAELLAKYVMIGTAIPESLVMEISPSGLPRGWRDQPPSHAVRAIGDAWVHEGESAVLRVPSALVPGEYNYLLNPRHADFAKLEVRDPVGFLFDPRLIKNG